MSETLYTHYNTILYRINRIQEITGANLNDSNDRLNLEIALKIRQMI
jgi:transcriptional regulator, CdaR family